MAIEQSEESTRRNFSPASERPLAARARCLSLSLGHYFIAVERMNSLMHPLGDHPTLPRSEPIPQNRNCELQFRNEELILLLNKNIK